MIYKYELIDPVVDKKYPRMDSKGYFIVPDIKKIYNYYIEVKRYNTNNICYEYFLLLGIEKFDSQCRKCRVDDYGRLKVKLHKELAEFVSTETTYRGNVKFEYIESEENYDIWQII